MLNALNDKKKKHLKTDILFSPKRLLRSHVNRNVLLHSFGFVQFWHFLPSIEQTNHARFCFSVA